MIGENAIRKHSMGGGSSQVRPNYETTFLDGKVLLLNKRCQEVINYKNSQVLGENWFYTVYSKKLGQKALDDYKLHFSNRVTFPEYLEETISLQDSEKKISDE